MNIRAAFIPPDVRWAGRTTVVVHVKRSTDGGADAANQYIGPGVSGRLIRPLRDKPGCNMRTRRHIHPVARYLARPRQTGATGP